MDKHALVEMITATEVDVSARFIYGLIETYGMEWVVAWYMEQYNTKAC